MMTGALERIRVLDFTTTIAGPHCTRLLADPGAEVIKIEAPEGDMMRTRPPLRNGASTSFGQLNAGKKSIVLDLKTPPAVEAVRRLPPPPRRCRCRELPAGGHAPLRPRLRSSGADQVRADLLRNFRLWPDRPFVA